MSSCSGIQFIKGGNPQHWHDLLYLLKKHPGLELPEQGLQVRTMEHWQGEEREEVILRTPTHSPLPADISLSPNTLSNDNSKKPFVCRYGTIDPFSAKENVCIFFSFPLCFLFNSIWVETKYHLSLLSRTPPK